MIQTTHYLTREQLAEKLQVDPKTVSTWVKLRGLPAVKLGDHRNSPLRFHEASVEKWFLAQQRGHVDAPAGATKTPNKQGRNGKLASGR